jgi:hypothetical protein
MVINLEIWGLSFTIGGDWEAVGTAAQPSAPVEVGYPFWGILLLDFSLALSAI